jgi:CheY-like chemotaxis protein
MISQKIGRPIHILMAEDNPDDIELAMEALKDAKVGNTLKVVKDGEEALAYLHGEGQYQGSLRPDPGGHPDHVPGGRRHLKHL